MIPLPVTCRARLAPSEHEERRLDWDRDLKGWPTKCRVCLAVGFTRDPTVPRFGAV